MSVPGRGGPTGLAGGIAGGAGGAAGSTLGGAASTGDGSGAGAGAPASGLAAGAEAGGGSASGRGAAGAGPPPEQASRGTSANGARVRTTSRTTFRATFVIGPHATPTTPTLASLPQPPDDSARYPEPGAGLPFKPGGIGRKMGIMAPAAPPRSAARAPAVKPPAAAAPAAAEPVSPARAISRAGALMGGFFVAGSALGGSGAGDGLGRDLPWMLLFAAVGLVGAGGAAAVIDRVLLRTGLRLELARGNLAAGITSAGHRIAAGIVAGSCLYGADLGNLAVGIVFLVIGVATLVGFQVLHRRLTRYDDDEEIRGDNAAAALGNAGLGIALAIIVGHAAEGSFEGWARSLVGYALALLLAVALYPVRQLLVATLILRLPLSLRSHALDREIAEKRNAAVGAVEGLAYVATALLVTGL